MMTEIVIIITPGRKIPILGCGREPTPDAEIMMSPATNRTPSTTSAGP
jgi:hypothetical protein